MVMVENLEQLALIKKPQQCFALHATSGYRSRRDTMAPDPPWDRIVLNLCRVVSGGVVEEPGFVFVEVGDGGVVDDLLFEAQVADGVEDFSRGELTFEQRRFGPVGHGLVDELG